MTANIILTLIALLNLIAALFTAHLSRLPEVKGIPARITGVFFSGGMVFFTHGIIMGIMSLLYRNGIGGGEPSNFVSAWIGIWILQGLGTVIGTMIVIRRSIIPKIGQAGIWKQPI